MPDKSYIVDNQIILKELSKQEVAPIFKIIDTEREYLGKWLPFVEYTLEITDTQNFIESLEISETKDFTFAIYFEEKFVGLVGLKDPDYDNKKVEIGYWISEAYQHKGIVTRSCKKLIDLAFNDLKMNRVQIRVATENFKSQQVAERLGFKFEGIEREGEYHKRGFLDLKVYSLLRNDYTGDS
jgi:ribosomal-protein-serine acetyltransferase